MKPLDRARRSVRRAGASADLLRSGRIFLIRDQDVDDHREWQIRVRRRDLTDLRPVFDRKRSDPSRHPGMDCRDPDAMEGNSRGGG